MMYSTNPTCTRERTPSNNEHVYAPERTPPQRAYAICGHESARSSAHRLCHTCTQERTPSTDEHVLGTPYAPVRTPPQRAYIYAPKRTPS